MRGKSLVAPPSDLAATWHTSRVDSVRELHARGSRSSWRWKEGRKVPLQFNRDRMAAGLLRRLGKIFFLGLLAVGLLTDRSLAAARPAHAAAGPAHRDPQVARVGYFEGEVSYLEADAQEWAPVSVNAPLVTGDRFYSGPDGRAEVQLPGGLYARLSNNTELDLLQVSSEELIVRVGVGTATFRVRQVPARRHIEFSTPATAVVARSSGVYRIDVTEDG